MHTKSKVILLNNIICSAAILLPQLEIQIAKHNTILKKHKQKSTGKIYIIKIHRN